MTEHAQKAAFRAHAVPAEQDQPLRVQLYVSPKSEMPAFMTTIRK